MIIVLYHFDLTLRHDNHLFMIVVHVFILLVLTSKPPFMSEFDVILLTFSFLIFSIAIVGDITPSDGISKSEKSRREQEALDYMCKLLGGGSRGNLSLSHSHTHKLTPNLMFATMHLLNILRGLVLNLETLTCPSY